MTLSKHRPDGMVTVWLEASRMFSWRELTAKANAIYEDIERGDFPISRFTLSIQRGFDIFGSDCWGFYIQRNRLMEFMLDHWQVPIIMLYLRLKWGGRWVVQWCEWSDPWEFVKGDAKK